MKPSLVLFILLLTVGMIASGITTVYYRHEVNRLQEQLQSTIAEPGSEDQDAPPTIDTDLPVSLYADLEHVDLEGIESAERIQELEQTLHERDEELERLRARFRPIQEAREEASPPMDRQTWLENLQTEDPDRYEEIMSRREAMRQRVNDTFARKAAHFLYRDTSTLDPDEYEEYELMLGLLAETWQMAERMQDPLLERRERWAIGREVMTNVRELQPMLEAERDREFYELAIELGYDDDGAIEFVDYLNDVIDVSTFGSIWRGMRGGGPGGRGR